MPTSPYIRRLVKAHGPDLVSAQNIAQELKRRHFTTWSCDFKGTQNIFDLGCGVKITLYRSTGTVLVQGRIPTPIKADCVAHLQQMLPHHTKWQIH